MEFSAVPVVRTDRRQRSTSQYMQSYSGPGKNVDGRGDHFKIMKTIKSNDIVMLILIPVLCSDIEV